MASTEPAAEALPQAATAGQTNKASASETDPGQANALDRVAWPVDHAEVALSSGRRVELQAGAEHDRIVVRGKGGEVQLRIEVGENGPRLSFSSAELELEATRKLSLRADQVALEAKTDIALQAGGDMNTRVHGNRHTHVDGHERLEAAEVEVQASDAAVKVRAMGHIGLDGEHIGLNNEALPAPFDWSTPPADAEPSR